GRGGPPRPPARAGRRGPAAARPARGVPQEPNDTEDPRPAQRPDGGPPPDRRAGSARPSDLERALVVGRGVDGRRGRPGGRGRGRGVVVGGGADADADADGQGGAGGEDGDVAPGAGGHAGAYAGPGGGL